MNAYEQRKREVIRKIAVRAFDLPVLPSGLWFHGDIRDNFYYASYLFAAAADPEIDLPFALEEAVTIAVRVLTEVLALQNRNTGTHLYGHWPLGLDPLPQQAALNSLPVELMGSLMAYFYRRYEAVFPDSLRSAFRSALEHVYRSRFFAVPLRDYGHHEAKYTAAKLIFGRLFGDAELLADGRLSLKRTLERLTDKGMSEYGALPWFWHWVQAFTCALELAGDEEADERADLCRMLDYLWHERALFYLGGAWAAPHSRGLRHDLPKDGNVLFDYVQFGDFPLPDALPRTEYAGFLCYEAPEQARRKALDRGNPSELQRKIVKNVDGKERLLHSYTFRTERFAAGGILERFEEFDNEQHRWDITLPLSDSESVNKVYFFHPGKGYEEGDPRHQSGHTDVLFHKNVIMAVYEIPASEDGRIVGVLPKGNWLNAGSALYGLANGVFISVYLMQPYDIREERDRVSVVSVGRRHGVVVEAISEEDAARMGIDGIESFMASRKHRLPIFTADGPLRIDYINRYGDPLRLQWDLNRPE